MEVKNGGKRVILGRQIRDEGRRGRVVVGRYGASGGRKEER